MTPIRTLKLAVFGAVAALALAIASNSHCAEWVHFRFTAPADSIGPDNQYVSGVGRYRNEAFNGSSWDSLRVYRAPGVEGVPVKPAGQLVDLYVSQTVTPLTSRTYRLVSIDNRGNRSPSSNPVVVATGFPDTLVGLSRPALGLGLAFRRTSGAPYTSWTLSADDSTEIHVMHQEDIQRAYAARLCELFGYWVLRGQRVVCP